MKKTILSILLLFLAIVSISMDATAQMSESLYNTLEPSLKPKNRLSLTDEEKANIIRGYPFQYDSSLDKEVNALIANGKNILATTNDQSLKVIYALAFGNSFANQGNLQEAVKYYKETIEYAGNNSKYDDDAAEAYVQLACIYSVYIQPDSAINWLYKALDLRKLKDSTFLNRVNNAYSLMYEKVNLYQQSIDYSKKYNELMDDADKWKEDYLVIWFNIVEMYNDLYRETRQRNYFDSSLTSLDSTIRNAKVDFTQWKTIYYFYKAQLYDYNNEYEKALSLYDSSLIPANVVNDIGRPNILARCKLAQAICLVKLGHSDAIKIIDTLHLKARDFFSFQLKYLVLYQDAKTKGNWQKALEYYQQYISYTDSLAIIETRGKVFEANQKYSVAEKEVAINNLEKEKLLIEKKDNKNRAIAIVIVLALIITILSIVWYYKQQQLKKEQQIAQLDNATQLQILELEETARTVRIEERKKMGMDLHDTLAGTLAAIKYKAEMILLNTSDEPQQKELRNIISLMGDAYDKARNKSHELYKSAETSEDSSFSERIKLILKNTLPGNISQKEITIDDASLRQISLNIKIELLQTIKESVTNILKHAKASKIELLLYRDANEVILIITDDGKGFDLSSPSFRRGLGMKSIYHRVKEMDGKINVSSAPGEGTELNIVLPIIDGN